MLREKVKSEALIDVAKHLSQNVEFKLRHNRNPIDYKTCSYEWRNLQPFKNVCCQLVKLVLSTIKRFRANIFRSNVQHCATVIST